jgi:hypothetical protein
MEERQRGPAAHTAVRPAMYGYLRIFASSAWACAAESGM